MHPRTLKQSFMANKERTDKWLDIVAEDLSVAELLFNTGHWFYAGFMCHQGIEKGGGARL